MPYLRTANLKNHTLFRGTYLYSPYMGVPPPSPGKVGGYWLPGPGPWSLHRRPHRVAYIKQET